MRDTPIKIKKGEYSPDQIRDDLKVDLNEKSEESSRWLSKKWLFLFIFLFSAVSVLAVGQMFFSRKMPFANLIPQNAVIFSLINQESLYNQTAPFYGFLRESNFYGQNAISTINDYLNQVDLNFKSAFCPLFKKQAAFVLMIPNDETPFPFAIIFQKNQSSAEIRQFLSIVEPNLKKDYNFSTEDYRQVKTTVLKPISSFLDNLPRSYAYAQIEEYFIICNSKQIMKELIDSIID
ncbi:MAG: hypothetical protein U9P63_02655 [Patescibacteria group bacterium]|nr:hypothetical protein [Patescibacteria group bacterium]